MPGERGVEPGSESAENFRVVLRLGFLEDSLESPPRPVDERDVGNHVEQEVAGQRIGRMPEGEDDLVSLQSLRQFHLGISLLDGFQQFDARDPAALSVVA